ncbi:hypothetical protein D4740_10860 [Actinomyces sp. 2119]|uniref:DUF7973 domain-containing protein n=1 Tax=Actinomyces lilanjuaniae TaxID=2321394 RepID=A0ABN5PNI0_9ACTO|nr:MULTISPECIES: hypothetical protein [Actinomyces]AYD89253.1 hypothetical protein D5R93_02820 [Actinomyces lilanjuaniae]RJF40665.1 hypothetical protein D4740_10860 [Actinomyces sp. 2119]
MFTASVGILLFGLVLACAGGAVGAAIGANYAFVLTGVCVLASWGVFAATGSTVGFDYLAFGPFMGPHVAFAGGVAGAAYAAYRGYVDDAKDINSPLAGLGRPDVLLAGAVFGALGYLGQAGISRVPWFGTHTDSVALTVLVSAFLARCLFGGAPGRGLMRGSLLNRDALPSGVQGLARLRPGENGRWLQWQERPAQVVTIGVMFGAFAGGAALFLAANVGAHLAGRGLAPNLAAANANTFAFGISAVIILFLITNRSMPVQHHVTNIAGLAAVQFFPLLEGSSFADYTWTATSSWQSGAWLSAVGAVGLAALFGTMTAFLAEAAARLWHNRGTSHIDPPAASIWLGNTVVVSVAALLS